MIIVSMLWMSAQRYVNNQPGEDGSVEDYDVISPEQWVEIQQRQQETAEDWEVAYNKKRIRSDGYILKYGLSLQQVRQIWLDQDCKCAICHIELPDPGIVNSENKTHVDHCHKTGRVRGILCNHCNRGLGCFKDSTTLLAEAGNYLLSYRHRYHGVSREEKYYLRPGTQVIGYKGKKQTIREWSEELSIPYSILHWRLIKGQWSVEKALTTPYRHRPRNKNCEL